MARPKLGDSETTRLHVKMTEDEIAAIDDWRFENRVASRSEAVRRLCEIARTLDSVIPNATDHASDNLTSNRLHYYFVAALVSKVKSGASISNDDLKDMGGWAADLVDRAEDILLLLMRESNRIVSLMDHENIKAALALAETAEEQVTRIIEAHIANEIPSESHFLQEVIDEMTDEEIASYDPLKAESQRELDAYLLGRIAQKRAAFHAYLPERYRSSLEEDE